MKNIVLILTILVSFTACNQEPKDTSKIDAAVIETDASNIAEPKLDFGNNTTHDFGKVVDGERVEHTFKFTNTGEADLVISSATASCGCTIPEWPKEPIAPGEKGEIKVEFNSAGKSDMVTKDITILANTNPVKTILQIKVFVEKKAQ